MSWLQRFIRAILSPPEWEKPLNNTQSRPTRGERLRKLIVKKDGQTKTFLVNKYGEIFEE